MRGDDDYERRSAEASRDRERLFAQSEQDRAFERAGKQLRRVAKR